MRLSLARGRGDERGFQDQQVVVERHRAHRDREQGEPAGGVGEAVQSQRLAEHDEFSEETRERRDTRERKDENQEAPRQQR